MHPKEKKINIKIITTLPYPTGMAGSNRIMTYAKGLQENNCNVSVICMKTTESTQMIYNNQISGNHDGVFYKYAGGKTVISSNVFRRRIDDLNGLLMTCKDLITEKKSDQTNVIIFYSFSSSRALALFLITRLKGILFLIEESEHPLVYAKEMSLPERYFFNKFYYRLFDGMLLMTKRLIRYFVEEKGMKIPYLHVPMTVDLNRFNIEKKKEKLKYIAYCGVLNNKKDGVDILIEAFALLAKDFPDIDLLLIGDAASLNEHELYIKKVKQNQIVERVIFTGHKSKDAIPELLLNAAILVLARPESIQSEGGFPTKLGEYLATGNPVVVTKVGEIPDYLADGVNAFIAEPGSIDSLYNKMKTILLDYTAAQIIGANGRKVADDNFNYKIQTKNIVGFINKQLSDKF